MTRIDLITGFLGSGKTTFLKRYVRFLLSKGERICILEFDYGAVNIDMMLLQEFNDSCDLEMVAGGCDYDCFLRRFKTKLIAMGMKHYDRVIIEPSGIFEPDSLIDDLYEEPLNNWYEMGSIISVVDPKIADNLSQQSKYLLVSQLACSGKIYISKAQLYTEKEVGHVIEFVSNAMKDYGLSLDERKIVTKDLAVFQEDDYESFSCCGYAIQEHIRQNVMEDNDFVSLSFLNPGLTLRSLASLCDSLFSGDCGSVSRIKGFILEQEKWHEFNMTQTERNVHEIPNGQDVILVIGERIQEKRIKMLLDSLKSN